MLAMQKRKVKSKLLADVFEAVLGAFSEASDTQDGVLEFLKRTSLLQKEHSCAKLPQQIHDTRG